MKKLLFAFILLISANAAFSQYARFEVDLVGNTFETSNNGTYTYVYDYDQIALNLKFYSDAACTIPYTISSGFYFD